jgi:hypothetical protein
MKKIILRENCFGPDVEIDGESLFIHEYDNRDPKLVETIQDELILKLQELKSGMGMDDWTVIAEIIVKLSGDFEYNVEESDEGNSCDQCGNWNHRYVYNSKT